jgi:hypothetical protein
VFKRRNNLCSLDRIPQIVDFHRDRHRRECTGTSYQSELSIANPVQQLS